MRSIEIPFSELKQYLLDRGEVLSEKEYIRGICWQMAYPEAIVFVGVDEND